MVVGANEYWRSIFFRSGKREEVLWDGIVLDIWRKLWVLKWRNSLSLKTLLAERSVCTRELYPTDAVYFPGVTCKYVLETHPCWTLAEFHQLLKISRCGWDVCGFMSFVKPRCQHWTRCLAVAVAVALWRARETLLQPRYGANRRLMTQCNVLARSSVQRNPQTDGRDEWD